MRLLIIYPTKGRQKLFFETLDNLESTIGTDNYEVIVNADRDDLEMNTPQVTERIKQYKNISIYFIEPISKVFACNTNIYNANYWDWCLILSDDMKFVVKDWYNKMVDDIKSVWGNSLDFFAHYNDGYVGDKLPTMNICGRDYYNRFGYLYHPSYGSVSCDAENFWVSQMLGKHHYFDKIYFNHIHPSNCGFVSDFTYRGNDVHGKKDTLNYFERMKHFFYVENPVMIPQQLLNEIEKLK